MEKIQRVRVTSAESGTSTEYGIQAGGQMSVQLEKDSWIRQQDGTYMYKIECLPTLSETDDCIVDFVSTPIKSENDALLNAWSAVYAARAAKEGDNIWISFFASRKPSMHISITIKW